MNQNKVLVVLLLAVAVAVAAVSPVAEDIVQLVNNHPNALWKAEHNKFSSYSDEQLRKMLGVKQSSVRRSLALHLTKRTAKGGPTPPENFDSRTQWPKCIHPIRDQGHCGSCWAFANSETLSDRFCIHSNGTIDVVLSPQELVSCDYLDSGCQGGMPRQAWYYTMHKGLVSESCFPYQSINGSQVSCPTNCKDDPSKTLANSKYYAKTWHLITSWFQAMELTIRQEVMANGPVEATMTVFRDFVQYKTGVYHHLTGVVLGLHAVKLVGWGVEESTKTPYWIVANSWSEKWGEAGYFRILRGRDESSIEDELYSVVPDLDRIPKH